MNREFERKWLKAIENCPKEKQLGILFAFEEFLKLLEKCKSRGIPIDSLEFSLKTILADL